ncbi:MAG: hypothetical protein EXS58_06370 [Candidatus Latescibacteria bacterium]|nr:hypothetical protein [Candidatus Latescibacterota bacterium]
MAVLGVLVLCACSGAMLPQLTLAQVQWAGQQWTGMEAARIVAARQLYVARCAGCHNLVLPAAHDLEKWGKVLPKMALKAKLNECQQEEIWRYLQTSQLAPAADTTSERAGR